MSVGFTHRGAAYVARISWALLAAGCASNRAASPATSTSVRLESPASAAGPTATGSTTAAPLSAPLPALPLPSGTIAEGSGGQRVHDLDVNGQELGTVVRALATSFGMQYQVDPAVRTHRVNARIRDQTLSEALAMIIPQGVTYEITNRTLRVSPARVETRTFALDYVALSRFGTASTVIQRRLGGGGFQGGSSLGGGGLGGGAGLGAGGFGAGGAAIGGADVISAVSVADIWEDIRMSLEALVFDAPRAVTDAPGSSSALMGMSGSGARTSTRTSEDGRRLIVNPVAGSITVTSFPANLAQVESFIRTFEASIQRQVLIEAKIVEVSLEDSTEFGIDWNIVARGVARAGSIGLTARSAPPGSEQTRGNFELTLSGRPGDITAVLNALSSQGNVRVLSSPRVSALNNQRAVFNVTTSEVIFTTARTPVVGPTGAIVSFETQVTPQQVQVGIVLDVLPQIGADNSVTMNIRPVVTSVARTAQFVQDGNTFTAPVIDTRESDTMARLRAGETIVIGGLMQNRSVRIESGVPGLKSVPLLGRLFRHTRNVEKKSELVIFLTPTTISGQPPLTR